MYEYDGCHVTQLKMQFNYFTKKISAKIQINSHNNLKKLHTAICSIKINCNTFRTIKIHYYITMLLFVLTILFY